MATVGEPLSVRHLGGHTTRKLFAFPVPSTVAHTWDEPATGWLPPRITRHVSRRETPAASREMPVAAGAQPPTRPAGSRQKCSDSPLQTNRRPQRLHHRGGKHSNRPGIIQLDGGGGGGPEEARRKEPREGVAWPPGSYARRTSNF